MDTRTILHLLLCTLLLMAHKLSGQVTILPTDVMQVGDRYRMAVDDSPTVGFGEPGANMTWIFSGLNNTWDYTLETMLAGDAPLGPVAPGAIAVLSSLENAAYHYDVDASALKYTGDAWDEDGTPMGMAYDPPRIQLQFPAQMGQQFESTSRSVLEWHVGQDIGWGFVVDSVRRRTHYAYSYVIDGWGQLSTPYGFFIAIRVNTLITTTDSIDAKPVGSTTWTTDLEIMDMTTREVAYWSPNASLPLLRLIDQGDWGFVSSAVWIAEQEISTGVNDGIEAMRPRVFPNPAVDAVQVVSTDATPMSYRLLDLHGSLVQQGLVTNGRTTIPLEQVSPGVYMLHLVQGGRTHTERIVVQ